MLNHGLLFDDRLDESVISCTFVGSIDPLTVSVNSAGISDVLWSLVVGLLVATVSLLSTASNIHPGAIPHHLPIVPLTLVATVVRVVLVGV